MEKIKIHNGQLITPYRNRGIGYVVVEGDKIVEIGEGDRKIAGCKEIDAQGGYITPGFIDIHTHGGGGHDFMDGTRKAFLGAARTHAAHGTTLLYPTTLTSTNDELFDMFKVFAAARELNTEGAALGGLHLEGPYFAPEQRGAQDIRYLRDPDPAEYMEILERGRGIIARWSLAPELEGAPAFGRELVRRGIIPAIAHTAATYEEVEEAFENGFRLLVHFYSCMSTITRRDAMRRGGVIEAGYGMDEMDIEIIGDGIHVPAPLLRLVRDVKGPGHIALVTDSMRGAGMPDGIYKLGSLTGGQDVNVADGVAKLLDGTAFAGSVATMDRCVRTMLRTAEMPLTDAVRMATSTPARIMGVADKKGTLACGKDADIVVFDDNIDVKMTMVGGRVVLLKC
jgi:N-acetylglucosamine-6-phosphate deacetylase